MSKAPQEFKLEGSTIHRGTGMKHAILVFMLLSPWTLWAQSGAGIVERTYRVNPSPDSFYRELLEITVVVADESGRSLTARRSLTAEEYAAWESGGDSRGLLLMKVYDSALADLERAISGGKPVGKESVDRRKVRSFVAYDDLLKYRVAKTEMDRVARQLSQLRASIASMERDAAALEVKQEEYQRQLIPAGLAESEPVSLRTKEPEEKRKAIGELGVQGPRAQSAIPELVQIILDSGQNAGIRMSALAAVGHIGVDAATAERILEVVRRESTAFAGSPSGSIVNGSFESGAGPGVALPPGSTDFKGWITEAGIIATSSEGVRPGGRIAAELGPRDPPGCISQAVLTTVGRNYQLRFFTDTGRESQFNRQLRVRVADVARMVTAPVGTVPELVRVPFKAAFPITTVTFCGEGTEQFGPMIDDVSIAPLD
jgi:hypothetical protein